MKMQAIFGPPGTGKTTSLMKLVPADKRVLMLSYTRAGALEIASRTSNDKVVASTIHSMAFNNLGMTRAQVVETKKLLEFGKETGIPFKGDADNVDESQLGDDYKAVMSYARNTMIDDKKAYDHFGAPGTWPGYVYFKTSYEAWKKAYGYSDFEDMLVNYVRVGTPQQWDAVFLDEAQDCSNLQWLAFNKMVTGADHVVIAGDDDQAIYEWNGANPHGMIEFADMHKAQVRVLDQSHRVPSTVHTLAHEAALFNIKRRVHKNFNPRKHEGQLLRFGEFYNVGADRLGEDVMVLARDRWNLEEIKRELNRDMTPFDVMGGSSPWTNRIAKELRAGGTPDIPWGWHDFYRQADLTQPINITLSTIHQAKGREAATVVLDLNLPSRTLSELYNDRDAELRVLYVALTRSSDRLILCGSNPLL